jgi:hypothetical protein
VSLRGYVIGLADIGDAGARNKANVAGTNHSEFHEWDVEIIKKLACVGQRLFETVHSFVAVMLDEFIALGRFRVFPHYSGNEFAEGNYWL